MCRGEKWGGVKEGRVMGGGGRVVGNEMKEVSKERAIGNT